MTAQNNSAAERLFEAIEHGRRVRRDATGWRMGAIAVADALVDDLLASGRVRRSGDRLMPATPAVARERPARMLAEQALPQDGEERPSATTRVRARSVTVNIMESPLGWLRARNLVSARQYEAGERLRGDWTIAGLGPRITMRWDAAPAAPRGSPAHGLDPTLAQTAARRRFDAAIEGVGNGLSDILWRTVCAGEGIEAAERALGWPRRAGKLVLLLALDRVADHYRLP